MRPKVIIFQKLKLVNQLLKIRGTRGNTPTYLHIQWSIIRRLPIKQSRQFTTKTLFITKEISHVEFEDRRLFVLRPRSKFT